MSIQILQYEFLGPIPLDEWGPPMEKVVYLIMSRDQDKFSVIYVGDCEKTEDESFFTRHLKSKCWAQQSYLGKSLYLAILPMFESGADARQNVINKIIARYKPACNHSQEAKPDYVQKPSLRRSNEERFSCACCGSKMNPEQVFEKSTLYRCTGCGLSDTRLNS